MTVGLTKITGLAASGVFVALSAGGFNGCVPGKGCEAGGGTGAEEVGGSVVCAALDASGDAGNVGSGAVAFAVVGAGATGSDDAAGANGLGVSGTTGSAGSGAVAFAVVGAASADGFTAGVDAGGVGSIPVTGFANGPVPRT